MKMVIFKRGDSGEPVCYSVKHRHTRIKKKPPNALTTFRLKLRTLYHWAMEASGELSGLTRSDSDKLSVLQPLECQKDVINELI